MPDRVRKTHKIIFLIETKNWGFLPAARKVTNDRSLARDMVKFYEKHRKFVAHDVQENILKVTKPRKWSSFVKKE
jgi:hypothetical protein